MMKKIWMMILACMTFLCLGLVASCAPTPKLAFNEGYLEEVLLGDPIMLDEYIDPALTDDYTAILTCDETGEDRDLKMLGQWTTDKPGTYTLTYTVNSGEYKGTVTAKIKVVAPDVEWQYSRPTLVYRAGDTMEFNLLKRNLNLLVKSYYDYTFYVKSVQVNGVVTDVSNQTSYTFKEEGEHVVTFAIKTEDGQELSANQKITVRPQQVLAEGAAEWMEENNITTYDYTYVSPDGKVNLDAGYYNNSFLKDNVPYIAFNGENGEGYGANTYVMVDFTGKNLPQVAFFCDEVTSSLTDGKNGIYFQNGTSLNDGSFWSELDASRLTIFGPNKVSYAEFDNKGRMLALGSVADPCAMSYNALSDEDSYRYIIGFSSVSANAVTARILLVNLTTGERVFDFTQRMTTYVSTSGNTNLNLSDDYFKGSIVLYGRYGIATEFDKVYMPITGISDIYELDVAAEFKKNYNAQCDLNTVAHVEDYIDIPATDYKFTVVDPEGQEVDVTAEGYFTYEKSGTYRLFFDPNEEGVRASSITVRVMYDLSSEFAADYFEKEDVIMSAGGTGLNVNKSSEYIKEGSQSILYYTVNGTGGNGLTVYVSKKFMNFVFLSRAVKGITFDIYSPIAVDYKLNNEGRADKLLMDYTGFIPAETWTTLTVTYEMCMKNYEVYKDKSYSLGICLYGADFASRSGVYVDNIKLIVDTTEATVADEAKAFMDKNNITAYGHTSIDGNLQVKLQEGRYQNEWTSIANDDVPYVAYEGDYGAGSYVVVDFTGKNVPQLCFFVQDITSSLVDGKAGLYVHTGMVKKNGEISSLHDAGRVTFLGPNKIEYSRPDSDGRVGPQHGYQTSNPVNSPLSVSGLEDGVHYRYVIGIKSAKVGRVVLEQILINLDNKEKAVSYETTITGSWLTADYISGNIVMYGRYNTAITLDKIYAVYENVSDAYAIDKVSEVIGA